MRIVWNVALAAALVLSLLTLGWLAGAGGAAFPPPRRGGSLWLAVLVPSTLGLVAGGTAALLVGRLRSRSNRKPPAKSAGDDQGGVGAKSPGEQAARPAGAAEPAETGVGPSRLPADKRFAAPPSRGSDRISIAVAVACIGLVALLVFAYAQGDIRPLSAALALICGTLTLLAGSYAMEELARGETIEISSHWGGLGGAMSGWRLSSVTTLLALSLIFLGATIATGLEREEPAKGNSVEAAPPSNESGAAQNSAGRERRRDPAAAAASTAPAPTNEAGSANAVTAAPSAGAR